MSKETRKRNLFDLMLADRKEPVMSEQGHGGWSGKLKAHILDCKHEAGITH